MSLPSDGQLPTELILEHTVKNKKVQSYVTNLITIIFRLHHFACLLCSLRVYIENPMALHGLEWSEISAGYCRISNGFDFATSTEQSAPNRFLY